MASMTGFHSTSHARRLRRSAAAVLLGVLLLGGAACSSDADAPTTTDTHTGNGSSEGGTSSTASTAGESATSTGDDGTTTPAGPTDDVGTGEASAEVTAYCDDVDEVVQLMADMRANPTNDAVNEVNDRLAQLTESATQLMADHPDEVDRINDCAEALISD